MRSGQSRPWFLPSAVVRGRGTEESCKHAVHVPGGPRTISCGVCSGRSNHRRPDHAARHPRGKTRHGSQGEPGGELSHPQAQDAAVSNCRGARTSRGPRRAVSDSPPRRLQPRLFHRRAWQGQERAQGRLQRHADPIHYRWDGDAAPVALERSSGA